MASGRVGGDKWEIGIREVNVTNLAGCGKLIGLGGGEFGKLAAEYEKLIQDNQKKSGGRLDVGLVTRRR